MSAGFYYDDCRLCQRGQVGRPEVRMAMIIVMSVALIYDQDDNCDAVHEEGKIINMQILCVFTILLKLPPFWAALLGK